MNSITLKEAVALLDTAELKKSQYRSIFISAFRKASKPIIKDARLNHRSSRKGKGKSQLNRSIQTSAIRNQLALKVGAKRRSRAGNIGNAGHLVDSGTKNRITKKGAEKGRVKGSRFLSKAIEQNASYIENTIGKEVSDSLTRYYDRRTNRR